MPTISAQEAYDQAGIKPAEPEAPISFEDAWKQQQEAINSRDKPKSPEPEGKPIGSLKEGALAGAKDYENTIAAIHQGVSPHMDLHKPNELGDAFQDDADRWYYHDKEGKPQPAMSDKHVILRDPDDNKQKVYARTPDSTEHPMVSLGRLFSGGAINSPMQAVARTTPEIAAATRIGVDLPSSVVGSEAKQALARGVSKIPTFGAGPAKAAAERMGSQLEGAASEATGLVPSETSTAVEKAGTAADQAITAHAFDKPGAKSTLGKKVNDAYDAVDQHIDHTTRAAMPNTTKVAQSIMDARTNANMKESKAVNEILGAVTDPKNMNYQGIKTLRTNIGEMLNEGRLPEDMSGTELKRIYGALSDDLKDSVYASDTSSSLIKGTKAGAGIRAFDKATRLAKAVSDRREALDRILGPESRSAEGLLTSIVNKASRAGADIKSLLAAKKSMPSDEWDAVAKTAARRLGTTSSKDEGFHWDPGKFVQDFDNLTERGKDILFGHPSTSGLRNSLEDISTVSKKWPQVAKLPGMHGHSGWLLAGIEGAHGIWEAVRHGSPLLPVTALSSALGVNLVSRALHTSASAAGIATWARAYYKLLSTANATGATPMAIEGTRQGAIKAYNAAVDGLTDGIAKITGHGSTPEEQADINKLRVPQSQ